MATWAGYVYVAFVIDTVAGYVGTFDNRSSLILFRNKAKPYLVQCSILYDVTRNPRVVTNCYELH